MTPTSREKGFRLLGLKEEREREKELICVSRSLFFRVAWGLGCSSTTLSSPSTLQYRMGLGHVAGQSPKLLLNMMFSVTYLFLFTYCYISISLMYLVLLTKVVVLV